MSLLNATLRCDGDSDAALHFASRHLEESNLLMHARDEESTSKEDGDGKT
jgi:hypothetical protein